MRRISDNCGWQDRRNHGSRNNHSYGRRGGKRGGSSSRRYYGYRGGQSSCYGGGGRREEGRGPHDYDYYGPRRHNFRPSAKERFASFDEWTQEQYTKEIEHQCPDDDKRIANSIKNIALNKPSREAFEKRRKAAEVILAQVILAEFVKDNPLGNGNDSDSSADGSTGGMLSRNERASIEHHAGLKRFIKALPYNLIFAAGFEAELESDQKNCWCPCSRHMETWRKQFNLSDLSVCEKGVGTKTPNALVKHLELNPSLSQYHDVSLQYLKELYGVNDHQAFWEPFSPKWKEIQRREERKRKRVEADNEEARKKLEVEKDELMQKNEALTEIEKKWKDIMQKKGIERALDRPLDTQEWERHKHLYKQFLAKTRKAAPLRPGNKAHVFKVPQAFSLSKLFHKWFNQRGGHILFQEVNDASFAKLVQKSSVEFENKMKCMENEKLGVDEGGPSREFFASVWKQVKTLTMKVKSSDSATREIRLFDDVGGAPHTDASLKGNLEALGLSHNVILDEMKRLSKYYEAIGRLIAHALLTERSVPIGILPFLYRSVCIRGTAVTDVDYTDSELLDHLLQDRYDPAFFLTAPVEEQMSDASIKNAVQKYILDERKVSVNSLIKGVTLDGRILLHEFFAFKPLQVVERLAFAKPCTKEHLIECLSTSKNPKELSPSEQSLFRHLQTFINEQDQDGLDRFVRWCTGQECLPVNREGFRIGVVFEHYDSNDPNALPQAHSCAYDITFPPNGYDGDKDKLFEKLSLALESMTYTMA